MTAFLSANFPAFAQTGRGATSAASRSSNSSATNAKKTCDGGYTGTVNYTKTVAVGSTGRFGSSRSMKRVYTANIAIRDDGKPQGTASVSASGVSGSFNFTGRAAASENENLNQLDVSEKDEYCSVTLKGAGKPQRVRCESRLNDVRQATGGSENVNVFVGLRGRTMNLSINNLPKLSGTFSRESSSSCTGTCSPQKPIGSSSTTEINNAGEKSAATDDGVIPFNPESFNRLAGTWTRTSSDGNTIETFQWNLARCAPALEIADVRFEHKRVPDPDRWVGVDPLSGTIDGNLVKIKAKVFNNGGDTAYANVKFSETKSNEALPDAAVSVMIKPGEYRDVEYEWDTSGFAWDENRKNQSEREIKAELEGGNTETAKIKILPKPVVLVHGLWSNAAAWAEYPVYLREAHSFAWKGYPVGADPAHGKMSTGDRPGNYKPTNTIYQNAQELAKQIKFAREENNAWHVDVVAHSMGGLISRQYINTFMPPVFDGKPEITHLVMLGTPNMGSPCADTVNEQFEEYGANEMHAMRELKPIIVRAFNTRVNDRKGVKFSVLIGIIPVPRTCLAENVFGDGVVPVESAKYNLTDYEYVPRNHIALTGIEDFKGFVMPRVAVGPKKSRAERATALLEKSASETYASADETSAPRDRYGFARYFQTVSYKRPTVAAIDDEPNGAKLTTKKKIVLAPKQSQEIEIPAEAIGVNGVLIVAGTGVAATLTDAGGAALGVSEGGLEAVKNPFRLIVADRKATGALMKLKLQNFADEEAVVFVAGFANSAAASGLTIETVISALPGQIALRAKWIENGAPVLNAQITGKIVVQAVEIKFYDDGKHDDAAANDGIYGARVEKLNKGEYFVEARAEANNRTKAAVAPISVGPTSTPNKTIKRGK